jgi:uncharacterized phage protein gp47/JayE
MAFDYSSRDFDTIKNDLLLRAERVFPEWTDRDPSDFGMLFVDLWAYAADVIHYYIDRVAGEAFLPTATQRESVIALANLLDYIPKSRSSAFGTVTLQNDDLTNPYTVPPYTEFVARFDEKTYPVYTLNGGLIPASNTSVIDVLQGELFRDEILTTGSTGSGGQRYALLNRDVVPNSLVVSVFEDGVNPTDYTYVPRIISAATGDRVYTINTLPDRTTEVVFGTSLNGFIPPSGSRIQATYATSVGAAGNLPANSVVAFKAAPPPNISLIGSSALAGGVDEESIESLKRSIPTTIASQNRAVTRNDFVALALQVEGVSKATIEFTPGQSTGPSGPIGNASVTVFPQVARADYLTTGDTTQAVSPSTQAAVVSSLQPRALLGVDVVCASSITWEPIDVVVNVFVNERYVSNWVKRDVESAIAQLFAFENVFFGQRLTLGQLYRIIFNVPGVEYAVITTFDLAGDTAVQDDILIDPLRLPKRGSVVLNMSGGITTS